MNTFPELTHVTVAWKPDTFPALSSVITSQYNMRTPLLRDDHQSLGGLAPALPGLRRDAEHVDRLRLEVSYCVLASAGVQHVHRGCVAIGGVQMVGDLVGCREDGEETKLNCKSKD